MTFRDCLSVPLREGVGANLQGFLKFVSGTFNDAIAGLTMLVVRATIEQLVEEARDLEAIAGETAKTRTLIGSTVSRHCLTQEFFDRVARRLGFTKRTSSPKLN